MPAQSSRTALITASYRALHQTSEGGRIFADPLANRILGPEAHVFLDHGPDDPFRHFYIVNFAGRSHYAEAKAEAAIARGFAQIVVLGAGYDTFGYRVRSFEGLRVFEVDAPSTQRDKRARLHAAGIDAPDHVAYVAVDFEHDDLRESLEAAGFDARRPAFFIWLGVIYYLTAESALDVLRLVGELPGAAEIVFDYHTPPPENLSPEVLARRAASLKRIAELGEPVRNLIEPDSLHLALSRFGFAEVEDLTPPEVASRYAGEKSTAFHPTRGWRFLHAVKPAGSSGKADF
jgi:methyltransferase (TIGR00027 family)